MPDVKLGPRGTETTLPALNWDAGGELETPIGYKPQTERAQMLDGSVRANFRTHSQKTFELSWALLPLADVLTLQGLADLREPLYFQNNWIDATWRWVWISAFDAQALQSTFAGTAKYSATMTLEEIA